MNVEELLLSTSIENWISLVRLLRCLKKVWSKSPPWSGTIKVSSTYRRQIKPWDYHEKTPMQLLWRLQWKFLQGTGRIYGSGRNLLIQFPLRQKISRSKTFFISQKLSSWSRRCWIIELNSFDCLFLVNCLKLFTNYLTTAYSTGIIRIMIGVKGTLDLCGLRRP